MSDFTNVKYEIASSGPEMMDGHTVTFKQEFVFTLHNVLSFILVLFLKL